MCGNFRCKSDRRSPKSYFSEILAAMKLSCAQAAASDAARRLKTQAPDKVDDAGTKPSTLADEVVEVGTGQLTFDGEVDKAVDF